MIPRPAPATGSLLPLVAAAMLPVPWLVVRFGGVAVSPLVVSVLTGGAILGAAFLLSWAAELLQMDVSQALALAVLALIAVLPEYAVDAVFAYQAGRDPVVAQQGYAVANMTGGNRLLIGLGWSAVVLLAWWRHGAHTVELHRAQALEVAVLLLATLYALLLPQGTSSSQVAHTSLSRRHFVARSGPAARCGSTSTMLYGDRTRTVCIGW